MWLNLASRKFLLALLSLLSSDILVWHKKITAEVYGMIIVATVAAYITGNFFQKKVEKE